LLSPEDRARVAEIFRVYEERRDGNKIILMGTPLSEEREKFYGLWQYFNSKELQMKTGVIRGETVILISPQAKERIWINVLLLVATFFTTTAVGSMFLYQVDILAGVNEFFTGLPFSLSLLTILGTHELGHYMMSRHWGVRASLPFFIPVPVPPLGTLGAVIKQRDPIPNRSALFDIGVSGPLVGLFVAIFFVVLGAMMGPYVPFVPDGEVIPGTGGGVLYLGEPLLFELVYNAVPQSGVEGFINPVAFAGWVGIFLTVLNLIPVGQLDGGHVARAVLGERTRWLSMVVPPLIIAWGFIATLMLDLGGEIWIFWGLITLLFANQPHPPPANDTEPVGTNRKVLSVILIVIFMLCFTPVPFFIG